VSERNLHRARWARLALGAAGVLLAPGALLAPGGAGAALPVPDSATNCRGALHPDSSPTLDDPNLVDYSFYCDGPISAYTLLINRPNHINDSIDDFNAAPDVLFQNGQPIPSESVACSGVLPGDGINCNAGAGGLVAGYAYVKGAVDTSDPFCANLPRNAKPGTKPEPAAFAQLVVTDATGAEDGPFRLWLEPGCKPVKPVTKPTKKTRSTKHRRPSRR
jgi:hypothetical protein